MLLLVLVLSPPRRTVLVLVFEAIQYSNPAHWSASSRERLRSTIRIAAVQKAIEYEYRFTEYRFAEYEYDEIRCEARTLAITEPEQLTQRKSERLSEGFVFIALFVRCYI